MLLEYFPASHSMHDLDAVDVWYWPARHAVHVPLLSYSPALHTRTQPEDPGSDVLPDSQFVHSVAPRAEYVPAAHRLEQLEAPVDVEYRPAAQSMQVEAPVEFWCRPAAHGVHSLAHGGLSFTAYLPTSQSVHSPLSSSR